MLRDGWRGVRIQGVQLCCGEAPVAAAVAEDTIPVVYVGKGAPSHPRCCSELLCGEAGARWEQSSVFKWDVPRHPEGALIALPIIPYSEKDLLPFVTGKKKIFSFFHCYFSSSVLSFLCWSRRYHEGLPKYLIMDKQWSWSFRFPFLVELHGPCEVKCPSSLINAIFAPQWLLQLHLVCHGESPAWEAPVDVIAEPF